MKKAALCLFAVFLAGCGESEDSSRSQLVGHWEFDYEASAESAPADDIAKIRGHVQNYSLDFNVETATLKFMGAEVDGPWTVDPLNGPFEKLRIGQGEFELEWLGPDSFRINLNPDSGPVFTRKSPS